jgi:hypothetical protein
VFDLTENGKYIINRRPIYLVQGWVPYGLKVAANGYVCDCLLRHMILMIPYLMDGLEAVADAHASTVVEASKRVGVLNDDGTLLKRVQIKFIVQNFALTGSGFEDLWIVGNGVAAR